MLFKSKKVLRALGKAVLDAFVKIGGLKWTATPVLDEDNFEALGRLLVNSFTPQGSAWTVNERLLEALAPFVAPEDAKKEGSKLQQTAQKLAATKNFDSSLLGLVGTKLLMFIADAATTLKGARELRSLDGEDFCRIYTEALSFLGVTGYLGQLTSAMSTFRRTESFFSHAPQSQRMPFLTDMLADCKKRLLELDQVHVAAEAKDSDSAPGKAPAVVPTAADSKSSVSVQQSAAEHPVASAASPVVQDKKEVKYPDVEPVVAKYIHAHIINLRIAFVNKGLRWVDASCDGRPSIMFIKSDGKRQTILEPDKQVYLNRLIAKNADAKEGVDFIFQPVQNKEKTRVKGLRLHLMNPDVIAKKAWALAPTDPEEFKEFFRLASRSANCGQRAYEQHVIRAIQAGIVDACGIKMRKTAVHALALLAVENEELACERLQFLIASAETFNISIQSFNHKDVGNCTPLDLVCNFARERDVPIPENFCKLLTQATKAIVQESRETTQIMGRANRAGVSASPLAAALAVAEPQKDSSADETGRQYVVNPLGFSASLGVVQNADSYPPEFARMLKLGARGASLMQVPAAPDQKEQKQDTAPKWTLTAPDNPKEFAKFFLKVCGSKDIELKDFQRYARRAITEKLYLTVDDTTGRNFLHELALLGVGPADEKSPAAMQANEKIAFARLEIFWKEYGIASGGPQMIFDMTMSLKADIKGDAPLQLARKTAALHNKSLSAKFEQIIGGDLTPFYPEMQFDRSASRAPKVIFATSNTRLF